MKKLSLSFLLLAICGFTMLQAARVDEATALKVAQNFMSQRGWQGSELVNVTSQLPYQNIYTFVAAQGEGFVMVSAEDRAIPVLGYSLTDRLDPMDIPVNANDCFMSYDDQIDFIIQNDLKTSEEIELEWEALEEGLEPPFPPLPTAVQPMVATRWNQSSPYNQLCPTGTYAGCSAIAMAQVMKYHNYPTTGRGSHTYSTNSYRNLTANFGNTTYQWSSMPNTVSGSSTAAQKTAVATLIYHVGVSMEMDYGTSGSGAATTNYGSLTYPSAENALVSYFKYSSSVHSISKADYSDNEWKSILKSELDASRPIIYSGFDSDAGHAFVLDGYDNTSKFHVNWGWGGSYDGYFAMGNLCPGGSGAGANQTGTYNLRNEAIIGIKPATVTGNTCTVTGSVSDASHGNVTGGGSKTCYDTVTLVANTNEGYRFVKWSDGALQNPRQFLANDNVTFTAQIERLTGDTLYYGGTDQVSSLGYGSNSTTHWGIRIPASSLTSHRKVSKVQFYVGYHYSNGSYYVNAGSYSIRIAKGSATAPTTNLINGNVNITSYGWINVDLAGQNINIDPNQSLWVIISTNCYGYPACMSYYGGNKDGIWISSNGTSWSKPNYTNSWMIRLMNEYSQNGGVQSIADVEINNDFTVMTEHNSITISDVEAGQTIRLFDNLGRMLESRNAVEFNTFQVPAKGTYLVQVGNKPARKVVVTK